MQIAHKFNYTQCQRIFSEDVLQCCDTVGWVIWPVKSSPKWPIMCRVGR